MEIRNRFDKNTIFFFKKVVKTKVIKKIKNLGIKKESLSSDISTEIIKEFGDLFPIFVTKKFDLCLYKGDYIEIYKLMKLLQSIRKRTRSRKLATDQIVFYVTSEKYMKELRIIK